MGGARTKKLTRRVALVALGLLALVLLAAIGVLLYLQSERGAEQLRARLLLEANRVLSGSLNAGRLDLRFGGTIVLRDVELRDPEGRLVARIGRLEAKLDPARLLGKQVHVESLSVVDAELHLVDAPEGLNLVRAVEPKRKSPPSATEPGGFDWTIRADELELDKLQFDFRSGSYEASPAFAAGIARLEGGGHLGPTGTRIRAALSGRIRVPVDRPLSISAVLEGGGAGDPFSPLRLAPLELEVGGSRLFAQASREGDRYAVTLERLHVTGEDLDALLDAESPLFVGPFDLTGRAVLEGQSSTAVLTLKLPRGSLRLDGATEFAPHRPVLTAKAVLEAVDLSTVLAQAPPTALRGNVDARLEAGEPMPGIGSVTIRLDGSTVRGEAIRVLTASADTRGLEATVKSLQLELAGGRATASGAASPERLDLRASVSASDLKRTFETLTRMFAFEAPHISGNGRLQTTLRGVPRAPTLGVEARFDKLQIATLQLHGLSLDGTVPDLTRPLALHAALRASHGAAGTLTFEQLVADLDIAGREIAGVLTTRGMLGGAMNVQGLLDRDQMGARLSELTASLNGAEWALREPAAMRWERGFVVDRAHLASGDQTVTVQGGLTGDRLDLTVRADRVDLAQIPKGLLPDAIALQGRIGLEAKFAGTTSRPRGTASFSISDGGFNALTGLEGVGRATLTGSRLEGSAALTRAGARLQAVADVPLKLLDAPPTTPLSAELRVDEAPLTDFAEVLALEELTAGVVSVRARLSGTAADPVLVAQVNANGVRYGAFPESELKLTARAEQGVMVDAVLDTPSGDLRVEAAAPLSLANTVRSPPSPESLAALPLRVKMRARRVLVEAFTDALQLPPEISGTLNVTAELAGSVEKPRGLARIRLTRGRYEAWTPLRADLWLTLAEDKLASSGRIGLGGERALEYVATADAPVERLLDLQQLGEIPLMARATVGPLPFSALAPEEREALEARLEGELELGGTLSRPLAKARLLASDVVGEGRMLGDVAVRAEYGGGGLQTQTVATLASGGSAQIDAIAQLDLGFEALRKGLDTAAIPIDLRAQASALNLALLDLLPGIRRAGGLLSMDGTIEGTLGSPRPRGEIAIRQGRATIDGFGSYRGVQLDAQATDVLVEVKRLVARAGRGSVEASARAERSAAGEPYRLAAKLIARDFPVPVKDQVIGTLTAETSSVTGSIGVEALELDLRLRNAELMLAERVPRDLQSLDQHPDIVVVRSRGERIDGAAPERPGAAQTQPYRLQLHLEAPRNLWVKSSDIVVEAGADVTAQIVGSEVDLSGLVEVKRARVDALGRKFEIDPVDPRLQSTHARLRFTGATPADAQIEVLAAHENQREQVLVNVGVTGTLRRPKIALSSEPPLEEAQIVTLLATGRLELKRGTGAVSTGSTAATALTALITDRLRKTVASQLPSAFLPDVLQVEIGQTTQVEAGMYLTDRLYLGYTHDFGARIDRGENLNEVRLEYQLTPSTSVEAFGGDAGSAAGELVWTRDY